MAARSKLVVSAGQSLSSASIKLMRLADRLNRARLFRGSIAVRAFEIFAANGHALGQILEEGFRAEQTDLVPVHVAERNENFRQAHRYRTSQQGKWM
jgi:hypothetical protein